MNIFVLDKDPSVAASYHCNKHVVKMILEAGQMLCVAHWVHALESVDKELKDFKRVREAKAYALKNASPTLIPPWTLTHTRHPCTVWTAINTGNYKWHLSLMRSLLDEYTLRYNKHHKSEEVYDWLASRIPHGMIRAEKTEHPQCMPDECKVLGDPVAAYRNYYIRHKNQMAQWEPRATTPKWYREGLEL